MDLIEWLMVESTVLNGAVIIRFLLLVLLIELFGVCFSNLRSI